MYGFFKINSQYCKKSHKTLAQLQKKEPATVKNHFPLKLKRKSHMHIALQKGISVEQREEYLEKWFWEPLSSLRYYVITMAESAAAT